MNIFEYLAKTALIWGISYGSIVITSVIDIPLWLVVLMVVGIVQLLILAFTRTPEKKCVNP